MLAVSVEIRLGALRGFHEFQDLPQRLPFSCARAQPFAIANQARLGTQYDPVLDHLQPVVFERGAGGHQVDDDVGVAQRRRRFQTTLRLARPGNR